MVTINKTSAVGMTDAFPQLLASDIKTDEKYNIPLLFTEPTPMAFDTLSSHWNVIVDGNSQVLSNPNPYLTKFNMKYAMSLYWRVMLFNEELALWMLQENQSRFFSQA